MFTVNVHHCQSEHCCHGNDDPLTHCNQHSDWAQLFFHLARSCPSHHRMILNAIIIFTQGFQCGSAKKTFPPSKAWFNNIKLATMLYIATWHYDMLMYQCQGCYQLLDCRSHSSLLNFVIHYPSCAWLPVSELSLAGLVNIVAEASGTKVMVKKLP